MILVWVVLIIVVLGATAAVAIGRGDSMSDSYPDRPDVRLPAERPLSSEDLEDLQFTVALRGYRMDEVDEVLRRLTREIAERDLRLEQLEGRIRQLDRDNSDRDNIDRDDSAVDDYGRSL